MYIYHTYLHLIVNFFVISVNFIQLLFPPKKINVFYF